MERRFFYYKLADSGNLMGEFTNDDQGVFHVECGERTDGTPKDSFAGSYNVFCNNSANEKLDLQMFKLTINLEKGNDFYKLVWNLDNIDTHTGIGRVVDGMLIGQFSHTKK